MKWNEMKKTLTSSLVSHRKIFSVREKKTTHYYYDDHQDTYTVYFIIIIITSTTFVKHRNIHMMRKIIPSFTIWFSTIEQFGRQSTKKKHITMFFISLKNLILNDHNVINNNNKNWYILGSSLIIKFFFECFHTSFMMISVFFHHYLTV